jgi:APA family basic amino acid/polyamine antiporter
MAETTARPMPIAPRIRTLGLPACIALIVGNMIGSGVFLLPASLAPYGWNAVFGWLAAIAGALCLGATFAALGRAIPRAGGPYIFTLEAFGPFVAFMVAWSYWVSLWVGNAGVAIGAISYLSALVPGAARLPGLPAFATCALAWILAGINCLGTRSMARMQIATTLFKLVPLFVVIAIAGWMLRGRGSTGVLPFHARDISPSGINACAALALWGLLGVESCTVAADSVRDPVRTIPRATLIGTAATGLIYLLVCSAATLLTDPAATARSDAPLADFVAAHLGAEAGFAVIGFAAISAIGSLNGYTLLQGELPFTMARCGAFPRWFGALSSRDTPIHAHLAATGLLTVVLLLNYTRSMAQLFTFLVLLGTAANLIAYLACSLAALKLSRTGRMPAGAMLRGIFVVAALFSAWTLWGAGAEALGWGAVLTLAGLPLFAMTRGHRAEVAVTS